MGARGYQRLSFGTLHARAVTVPAPAVPAAPAVRCLQSEVSYNYFGDSYSVVASRDFKKGEQVGEGSGIRGVWRRVWTAEGTSAERVEAGECTEEADPASTTPSSFLPAMHTHASLPSPSTPNPTYITHQPLRCSSRTERSRTTR